MSNWTSVFQSRLMTGENLLAVVENLSFSIYFVPHATPNENYPAGLQGAMALTNHRLIAVWAESQGWKWLHMSALNSLWERPLRPDKSSWPHQVVLMVPGGIELVVQTQTPNAQHAQQLSALVAQALVTLC